MATNIKHLDSKKYNKALSLNDRLSLETIITTNRNKDGSLKLKLNDIANMLEKDPTTLSKEVKKRRFAFKYTTPNFVFLKKYCNLCLKADICNRKCNDSSIKGTCPQFEYKLCKYTTKFPYVCNGCSKRAYCSYPKTFYKATIADTDYKTTLTDSREGSTFTYPEFKQIDDVISAGLKLGQSVEHIIHSNDLPISTKTVYNYLHKGYFSADIFNTHRMIRFKLKTRKKPENSKIMRTKKKGHQYEDYLEFLSNNPGQIITQLDTIEGKKGGKVILSMKITLLQFQFYFLLNDKKAESVVNKLNEIEEKIGSERYKQIFGCILTDNGVEFSDIDGMAFNPKTAELRSNIFFCHPMMSGEKGSCERNHELLRYILPKSTSFDQLTQMDINDITSHVNSLKRKSTDYSTPIEKFCALFGKETLDLLGITLIEPNQVNLTHKLIKK